MGEAIVVAAEPGRLSLLEPFVISRGVEDWYDVVEVSATWRGVTGVGEATPVEYFGGETNDTVVSFVARAAEAVGSDPFALEKIGHRLNELPGDQAAKAGLDAALHDLVGKLVGQPLWRLLGVPRWSPPTASTVSLGDPDVMARAAEKRSDGRFALLKLKLGGRDGHDLARVVAVRLATRLPLMVDVNEYWSFEEALELIPALAELGVTLVEQPLVAGSPDGPELKHQSVLPVILDEDCHTLGDVADCAQRGHGINIKLAKSGGIREAIRMVHAARALGLSVMIGCMGESSLGLAPACPVASLCDHVDLDGNLGLSHDPWQGLDLIDGVQVPSELPGLGVVRRVDGR